MHQINLSDQLFQETQRRAVAAGFASVDEFVADVLLHSLHTETEDFDHLFSAERLAHIDRAAAQIEAGLGVTSEQVTEHFRQKLSG